MIVELPKFAVFLVVGPPGSGVERLVNRCFSHLEAIDVSHLSNNVNHIREQDAFEVSDFTSISNFVSTALAHRSSVLVTATDLHQIYRDKIAGLARLYHAPVVVISFEMSLQECLAGNEGNSNSVDKKQVVSSYNRMIRLRNKPDNGVSWTQGQDYYVALKSAQDADEIDISYLTEEYDYRGFHGPFDIIGDIHGCLYELISLLDKLGYDLETRHDGSLSCTHAQGRKIIFVGDLIDRGPNNNDVLAYVMDMVEDGHLCLLGNHDEKLKKHLNGRKITVGRNLAMTLKEFDQIPVEKKDAFLSRIKNFLNNLPSHLWLDDGRLVVVHAGLKENMHGRSSHEIDAFCIYGDPTGEVDKDGFPVRRDWAAEYSGNAIVVHGHVVYKGVRIVNNVWNIDTGCVFGGHLTALRYPEMTLVNVPALKAYHPWKGDQLVKFEGPTI
jgi:protein phosphatase